MDASSVTFDNALTNRQTEAHTLRLSSEQGRPKLAQNLSRHTATRIRETENHFVINLSTANRQCSTSGHSIEGIFNEIHKNATYASNVNENSKVVTCFINY